MSKNVWYRWRATAFAIAFAGVSAWPTAGAAQTVTGQARAVQVNATTVLTDTGTLIGTSDARDATLDSGIVPSVLSGEVLRAVAVGAELFGAYHRVVAGIKEEHDALAAVVGKAKRAVRAR